MKKIIFIIPILILTLTSLTWGDPLYLGSRWWKNGIYATGPWAPETGQGFGITWAINNVPGPFPWEYNYTIYFPGKEISHWIFEVSEGATIYDFNFSSLPDYIKEIEGPKSWTHNSGNPGMPGNIWGIKFDFNDDLIKGMTKVEFTFYSTMAPMWGDFYAKDGAVKKIDVIAYNIGLNPPNPPPTSPYTNWIAVPDTKTIVPEPGLLILLGLGLTAVGVATRFVRKV